MAEYLKPSWAGSTPVTPTAPAQGISPAPPSVHVTGNRTVPARPAPPPPPIDMRPIYDPAFLPTDPGGQQDYVFRQEPWDWPPHVSNYHKARHVD